MVDIIVPCFNPSENWAEKLIVSIKEIESKLGFTPQLIIVNDGSSNRYFEAESDLIRKNIETVKILKHKSNKGKGAALKTGIEASESDYIVYTDIDFPYTSDSFLTVLKELETHDVVFPKRDKRYYEKNNFFRKSLSKSFRFLIRLFFRLKINDTQTGLKGLNQDAKAILLRCKTNGFLMDLEFAKRVSRSKRIKISTPIITPKDDLLLSNVGLGILLKEAKDLFKILFMRP